MEQSDQEHSNHSQQNDVSSEESHHEYSNTSQNHSKKKNGSLSSYVDKVKKEVKQISENLKNLNPKIMRKKVQKAIAKTIRTRVSGIIDPNNKQKLDHLFYTVSIIVIQLFAVLAFTNLYYFELLYSAIFIFLMTYRVFEYRLMNCHYQLLEFCQASNWAIIALFAFYDKLYEQNAHQTVSAWKAFYIISMTQLAQSTCIFSCKFVIQDIDKTTSHQIHFLPYTQFLLCWHFDPTYTLNRFHINVTSEIESFGYFMNILINPMLFWLVWIISQILIVICWKGLDRLKNEGKDCLFFWVTNNKMVFKQGFGNSLENKEVKQFMIHMIFTLLNLGTGQLDVNYPQFCLVKWCLIWCQSLWAGGSQLIYWFSRKQLSSLNDKQELGKEILEGILLKLHLEKDSDNNSAANVAEELLEDDTLMKMTDQYELDKMIYNSNTNLDPYNSIENNDKDKNE